jgi:hypothetical protein
MTEQKRVEVGFSGGQAIALRLSDDSYERLRRSLADGGRWVEVETLDGPISLDVSQVVFLRLDAAEHRVGFSGL